MFANVGRMPQAKQFRRQSTRISPSSDCAEILEQEVLANRGSDMFPRENLIGAALTMRVKERIESVLFKGMPARHHISCLHPRHRILCHFSMRNKPLLPCDGHRARARLQGMNLLLWSRLSLMLRSRISSRRSNACLALICSGVSQETHWNGVCDLGTNVLTPAL